MSPIKTVSASPRNRWSPPAELVGAQRIAAINDRFRRAYGELSGAGAPGRWVVTQGIARLDPALQFAIIRAVRASDDFEPGDDPRGEHDFGVIAVSGVDGKIFWKIDVYADDNLEWGAEDAGDLDASYRLLTILLASEY